MYYFTSRVALQKKRETKKIIKRIKAICFKLKRNKKGLKTRLNKILFVENVDYGNHGKML